jgi:hypothetical protein
MKRIYAAKYRHKRPSPISCGALCLLGTNEMVSQDLGRGKAVL